MMPLTKTKKHGWVRWGLTSDGVDVKMKVILPNEWGNAEICSAITQLWSAQTAD